MLIEWARWRRVGAGVNVDYPPVSPYARGIKSGWATKTPLISDNLAGMVDLAVSRLKMRCIKGDHRWAALTDYYMLGKTDSNIARRLKIDRRTAMAARHAAESWVDAYLDSAIDG